MHPSMELGDIFREKGGNENLAKAVAYYERASERGHPDAPYWLGVLCEAAGAAGDAGAVEAAGWYELAAERGCALAQTRLAEMYRAGKGVARDDVAAAFWHRMAASQTAASRFPWRARGARGARARPYECHYDPDERVARSRRMAAEFFLRAARQGHAQAQYRVARMLRSGEWYEKDELASARWMHRAADAGHVEARLALSLLEAR